jgi:cephalosporin-C deacetylase
VSPVPRPLAAETTTVPRPADFEEFWQRALAELAAVPTAEEFVRRADLSTPDVDIFDVRYDGTGGVRVAGWYARPSGPAPAGGFPGLLLIPGYISDPTVPKTFAAAGYAVLSVAPRGKLRATAVVNPGYPGLLVRDIVDPESWAYRGFFLDTVRGFDVLASRAEVDPTRVGVHGSSQGGGLGVAVAALRPGRVACLSAGAPFLCAIVECVRLTRTYPYQEIREFLQVHPELLPAVERSAAYLDGLNLAAAVRCPTQVYLGLRDDVCPPESGFALVRHLPVDVELHTFEGAGHDAGLPEMAAEIDEFLARHLRPVPTGNLVREAETSGSNA